MPNSVISSRRGNIFLYTGPSMLPTFNPGDELQLEDRELTTLHHGDVVVFKETKNVEPITVVHRIVQLRNGKFYTRGDNNLHLDLEPLSTAAFIGVVVSRRRRGRNQIVINGFSGWLYANILFIFKWFWDRFKCIFRPLYAFFRRMHLKYPLWKPAFTTLILHTEKNSVLVKTLYHSRTVARYWPKTRAYQCRKPFDLVLKRPEFLSSPVTEVHKTTLN